MRKILPIQTDWQFKFGETKHGRVPKHAGAGFQTVSLPHTWNALDGQDGGFDYQRGAAWYLKTVAVKPQKNERVYVEFLGANSICRVYVNGKQVAEHKGGFSAFRCDVTDSIRFGKLKLAVMTDNGENKEVYPQTADFTFFGGLYRGVNLITVPESHFDLDYYGTPGVIATPKVQEDGSADVDLTAFVTNPAAGQKVRFTVDGEVLEAPADAPSATLHLENPHLWNGRMDPYLYTVKAELLAPDGTALDEVTQRFGVRTFSVDPEKGFFLNGRSYPLRGVSRHQDRLDMGWAITEKEHREDMELIAEIGANTIRLAHYQHSQTFYDLCDEYGMVVWAEIPFISNYMDNDAARANTVSQMKELVLQNYNHPSIVCWGIANEITIGGETPSLMRHLHTLNDLCHELDKTRLTTIAQLSMVDMDSPINQITDIISYNHYFGWYIGDVADNGPWLDEFHEKYPNICLGISEYGCEGILQYHNDHPQVQDYSEEYQAYYHENMLKIFEERPFLWSTHVWNMFDFASDMRDEGGVKGRNNKGLVTFDRKTKKDSFYIYKAYWTDAPFVHICSRRYADRPEESISVKVYSNCPRVTLYVNGAEFSALTGDKVFIFENVPLHMGENTLKAVSDAVSDAITLNRTEEANPAYALNDGKAGTGVKNWFDEGGTQMEMTFREGYLSVQDKLGDVMKTDEGEKLINGAIDIVGKEMNMNVSKGMLAMIKNFTIEKIFSMAGSRVPQGLMPVVNAVLQQVAKPDSGMQPEMPSVEIKDGFYSVADRIENILKVDAGKAVLTDLMQTVSEKLGVPAGEGMLALFGGFTVHQLLAAAGGFLPENAEEQVNQKLQEIAK